MRSLQSVRRTRTGGVSRRFFFFQGKELLGSGSAIRVMLMDGVFELLVVLLHMLFMLLLVELALVLR